MMFATRKSFHIGDVLSVITDHCLSPRGEEGHRDVVEYMAARPLSLNDRLIYHGALRRALAEQHPDLPWYDVGDVPPAELLTVWLARRSAEFGEYLTVRRLAPDDPIRARPVPGPPGVADE